MAEIQKQISHFRRKKADLVFDQRDIRGFHSIVVFDKTSLSKVLSQADNKPDTEVLYFDAESNLLLSKNDEVITRVPGGEYNSLSFIGAEGDLTKVDPSTATGKSKPSLLEAFINKFCHKNSIGSVLIQPTDNTSKSLKALMQRFEGIRHNTLNFIGSIRVRSARGIGSECRLFPGETNALQQPRVLPGTVGSKVISADAVASIMKKSSLPASAFNPPTRPTGDNDPDLNRISDFRAEFTQRTLEFNEAFDTLKAAHNLPDDTLPKFDTLERSGDGWRMDFIRPDTDVKQSITFDSGAFDRFNRFIQRTQNNGIKRSGQGRSRALGAMENSQSLADFGSMVSDLVRGGQLSKKSRPAGMTDSQYKIYLGQQYLGYIGMSLQTVEVVDLGISGIKIIAPGIKSLELPKIKLPKSVDKLGQLTLPSSIKKFSKMASKAGRYAPGIGTGFSFANLGLTMAAYGEEEDADVRELMKSKIAFDTADAYISLISELAGPAGILIDRIMDFARDLFESWYEDEYKDLYFERLLDVSKELAKNFNNLHKNLNPDDFMYDGMFLNFLMSTPDKKLLPINIKDIDLAQGKLRYGGVYADEQTHDAGKKDNWDTCPTLSYTNQGEWYTEECADDINEIKYGEPFDLVGNALKTLCKTESRLARFKCADGVYKKINFLKHYNTILMPAATDWKLKPEYSAYDRRKPSTETLYQDSPGATLLDAVDDEYFKRHYEAKIIDFKSVKTMAFKSSTKEIYKHVGQVLTNITDISNLETTSTLRMGDNDYKVIFHSINDEASKLLTYDIHALASARQKKYTMVSDAAHTINLHPAERNDSVWMLSYTGKTPYTCIAENDSDVNNCSLQLGGAGPRDPAYVRKVVLGEATFNFRASNTGHFTHKVMASDKNALFEFLPDGGKQIHLLRFDGDISETSRRVARFKKLSARYSFPSRFTHVAVTGCTNARKHNYNCHPLPTEGTPAQLRRADRLMVWFDKEKQTELKLVVPGDQIEPIQGDLETGYYFYNRRDGRVFFKKAGFLIRDQVEFRPFNYDREGSRFGSVTDVKRTDVPNKLVVYRYPIHYQLTADDFGNITPKEIAVETSDVNIQSSLGDVFYNKGLVPLRIVNDRFNKRNLLRTGFFDPKTKRYIAYRVSLLDGGSKTATSGNALVIDDGVRSRLNDEHLPVHKVVQGQTTHYIMFSKHSGQLFYLTAEPGGEAEAEAEVQKTFHRIDSGFKVIRPVSVGQTVSEVIRQPAFVKVQGFRDSVLAETVSGDQLRIPDSAWSDNRLVKSGLSLEAQPFENWQVKKTGQTFPKSSDTLSVHTFKTSSGIMLEGLEFGAIVNRAYAAVFNSETPSDWTDTTAQSFVTSLKTLIKDRIRTIQAKYPATANRVRLSIKTELNSSALLSFMKQQDFWYLPSDNALLTADSRDHFRIAGNDGEKLVVASDNQRAFSSVFYPRPERSEDGHPFCGSQALNVISGFPTEFSSLISVPCQLPMFKGIPQSAQFQWDRDSGSWNIEADGQSFKARGKQLQLTAVDFRKAKSDIIGTRPQFKDMSLAFFTREYWKCVMDNLSERQLLGKLYTTDVVSLNLQTKYTPDSKVRTGWINYQTNKFYLGLPDEDHETQQLVGGNSNWVPFYMVNQGVVYNTKTKTLTSTNGDERRPLSTGPFDRVEMVNKVLMLVGTANRDQFNLDGLHLDTFFRGPRTSLVGEKGESPGVIGVPRGQWRGRPF
ncbi:hypothetical protein [Endozoicomonas sp. NE40]|uniref:hypothetical protein n=1 Tax=Endozoicomonas lisbonensis TaxID=3120522 RepID=UPI003395CF30